MAHGVEGGSEPGRSAGAIEAGRGLLRPFLFIAAFRRVKLPRGNRKRMDAVEILATPTAWPPEGRAAYLMGVEPLSVEASTRAGRTA